MSFRWTCPSLEQKHYEAQNSFISDYKKWTKNILKDRLKGARVVQQYKKPKGGAGVID